MRLAIVAAFALGAVALPASAQTSVTFQGGRTTAADGTTVFRNFDGVPNGTALAGSTNGFVYTSSNNSASQPGFGSTGGYGAVLAGGRYTVNFGPTDVFSFVLGSLDSFNTLRLFYADGTFFDYAGGAIIGGASFQDGSRGSTTSNGVVTYRSSGPAIVGARFTSSTNSFEFDNLAVGSAAVPEPATWGLMILGFGAIGGAMRRRSATRTQVRFAA